MRKVSIVVCSIFIISCNNSDNVPSEIITQKQMQNIFWDMIRGDLLAKEIARKDSSKNEKAVSLAITDTILAIHKINRAQFKESLAFYEKHPSLMRTIFDSLNAIQTRNNTSQFERKFKPGKNLKLTPGNRLP